MADTHFTMCDVMQPIFNMHKQRKQLPAIHFNFLSILFSLILV